MPGSAESCSVIPAALFPRNILDAIPHDLGRVCELLDTVRHDLRDALGPMRHRIGDEGLTLMFAALAAGALKRYGPGSLPNLSSMLAAEHLDCSNHGLLTYYLASHVLPELDSKWDLRFVGWESERLGNHQMLFAEPKASEVPLLLEPTLAIVGLASFDELAMGRPVDPRYLAVMPYWPELDGPRGAMLDAILHGGFRPSDLLYFFEGEQHYLHHATHPSQWPTPGAMRWRRLYTEHRS